MKYLLLILFPLSLFSQQVIDDCYEMLPMEYSVTYDVDKVYYWDVPEGNIISQTSNVIVIKWPDSLGTYVISVSTTKYGCYGDTSTYTVTIEDCPYTQLFIPNAFTPTQDGHNELYSIEGRDADEITFMVIFNRWGEKVFEFEGNGDWDGTYENNECQMGVYVIKIWFRNNVYSNQIHLIR